MEEAPIVMATIGASRRGGDGGSETVYCKVLPGRALCYRSDFAKIRTALCPPNPIEFDIAYVTSAARATFGT